jgi:hypothetical protein
VVFRHRRVRVGHAVRHGIAADNTTFGEPEVRRPTFLQEQFGTRILPLMRCRGGVRRAALATAGRLLYRFHGRNSRRDRARFPVWGGEDANSVVRPTQKAILGDEFRSSCSSPLLPALVGCAPRFD